MPRLSICAVLVPVVQLVAGVRVVGLAPVQMVVHPPPDVRRLALPQAGLAVDGGAAVNLWTKWKF